MRHDIENILYRLSKGENVFFEQDKLPIDMRQKCLEILNKTQNIEELNYFFDNEIENIIFHSHQMYLTYR